MNADIPLNLTRREQLKLSLSIQMKPDLLLHNNKSGVRILNQEASLHTEPGFNLRDPKALYSNLVSYMNYMNRYDYFFFHNLTHLYSNNSTAVAQTMGG